MLVALSDTHGTDDPNLTPHLRKMVRQAEVLLHAGDFMTPVVLEAFETASNELVAVYGNNDGATVRNRVPETQVFDWRDKRFLLVHGHRHTGTALSLLARQEEADVVIVGHSHRPEITELDETIVVNPGSHAQPRRYQAAYAVFRETDDGIAVQLRTPEGEQFESLQL